MKLLSLLERRISLVAGALWLLAGAYFASAQTSTTNFQVAITLPTNGSSFAVPASVLIDAATFDIADDVAYVVFEAGPGGGGVKPDYILDLGTVSNGVATSAHGEVFALTWTNPPLGTWALTVEAVRSNGLEVMSPPVTITVKSTNALFVDIASPTNGSTFVAPANVQLIAGVSGNDGVVANVQFFDGTNSLGVVSNGVVVDPPGSPGLPPGSLAYLLTWSNAPVGTHVLTAVAVETNGQSVGSAPVTISVVSNLPPVVRITSPPNNSVFRAPVNIALLAYANDPGGFVSSVQFFAGSNSLGFGLPVPLASPQPSTPPPGSPISLTNLFELIWSNAPVGSYAITAVATASGGVSVTSTPVDIAVVAQTPPPTNKPDVVSIIAIDPVAIAGTNCWPWLGLSNTNPPPAWSNWVSATAVWRWFTNCGPKDATFAVCRAGETNSELTVSYSIGGTASNGVDYAALSGLVSIPAGQTAALITIIPLDDPTNTVAETVILSLNGSTNSPPDYVLGFPRRAEALILDSGIRYPVLPTAVLGDRTFHLNAAGPNGAWFRVDYTTDCLHWTPVCTNQVVNGSIDFADPDAASSPTRLYRSVPLSNPPLD
jgi:hypothetical protein